MIVIWSFSFIYFINVTEFCWFKQTFYTSYKRKFKWLVTQLFTACHIVRQSLSHSSSRLVTQFVMTCHTVRHELSHSPSRIVTHSVTTCHTVCHGCNTALHGLSYSPSRFVTQSVTACHTVRHGCNIALHSLSHSPSRLVTYLFTASHKVHYWRPVATFICWRIISLRVCSFQSKLNPGTKYTLLTLSWSCNSTKENLQ